MAKKDNVELQSANASSHIMSSVKIIPLGMSLIAKGYWCWAKMRWWNQCIVGSEWYCMVSYDVKKQLFSMVSCTQMHNDYFLLSIGVDEAKYRNSSYNSNEIMQRKVRSLMRQHKQGLSAYYFTPKQLWIIKIRRQSGVSSGIKRRDRQGVAFILLVWLCGERNK